MILTSFWGHEAALEDAMLKKGGGVCGSICPWFGGGGWSQLLRQVEETGPRPCVVQCCLVDWNGLMSPKLPGWLKWADEPKVAWLIEMGWRAQSCLVDWNGLMSPLRGLVIFSSSLLQLRVDKKQICSRWYSFDYSFITKIAKLLDFFSIRYRINSS